jgi:hypothetical protein
MASSNLTPRKSGHRDLRDVDLRIGSLPEQEVAEPHLAAGTDDEVELWQMPLVYRF